MKEIEVKILEINVDDFVKKLKDLGAKKDFEGDLMGQYYDVTSMTADTDATFRVRKEGDKSYITLKRKIKSNLSKSRDEYEIEISDYDIAKTIFEKLNFTETKTIDKHRISYFLEDHDVHVVIDKFANNENNHNLDIPAFAEIEAKSEEKLFEIVELLGYKQEDTVTWSCGKVIEYYKEKK